MASSRPSAVLRKYLDESISNKVVSNSGELREFMETWHMNDDAYARSKLEAFLTLENSSYSSTTSDANTVGGVEPIAGPSNQSTERSSTSQGTIHNAKRNKSSEPIAPPNPPDKRRRTHVTQPLARLYGNAGGPELEPTQNGIIVTKEYNRHEEDIYQPAIRVKKKEHNDNRHAKAGFDTREHYKDSYDVEKVKVQTYRNQVKNHIYKVKFNNGWTDKSFADVFNNLESLFDDLIEDTREGLRETDSGRILINHGSIDKPIVVELQELKDLNGKVVLDRIERVMNSHQNLAIDNSFTVEVGMIQMPTGSGRVYATNNESLKRKNCIKIITNNDNLCLHRAIAVSWATKMKNQEKWDRLVKPDKDFGFKDDVALALKYNCVSENLLKEIQKSTRKTKSGGRSEVKRLKHLAVLIGQKAGVSITRPASFADIPKFEKALNVNILVTTLQKGCKFITPGIAGMEKIFLLYSNNHFDSITNIKAFFTKTGFCQDCLKAYDKRKGHSCALCCATCQSENCAETSPFDCPRCNQRVRSNECYDRHSNLKTCFANYKCPDCKRVVNIEGRDKKDHICGEVKCRTCYNYVTKPHLCYTRSKDPSNSSLKVIHFDFEARQDEIHQCDAGYVPHNKERCDLCLTSISKCLSCARCVNCNDPMCGRAVHKPNLVVAHSSCDYCKTLDVHDDSICEYCGSRCEKCGRYDKKEQEFTHKPCEGCGLRQVIFSGDETVEKFCEWLFSDAHHKYTVMAHNCKGYDGFFLVNYLLERGMNPSINFSGSKMMSITVRRGLDIKIIDSLNFLAMRLAAFPKTFGFQDEVRKGYFPHYFNTLQNSSYIGPYPAPDYYGVDYMSASERDAFFTWYENIPADALFDMQKEMLLYCKDDVSILRKATLQFRQLIIELTGDEIYCENTSEKKFVNYVDPFDCTTIAGVCMRIYRSIFMEETWEGTFSYGGKLFTKEKLIKKKNKFFFDDAEIEKSEIDESSLKFVKSPIAFLPNDTYTDKDQYSIISIKWLAWMEKKLGIKIQHALNHGEKVIQIGKSKYKIDGYYHDKKTSKKYCFEFNGCKTHACVRCFPVGRNINDSEFSNTLETRYMLTELKRKRLMAAGYKVITKWYCDFMNELNTDKDMSAYIEELEKNDYFVEKLDIRSAFFGGRVNACTLYYKAKEGEKIEYVDFTSLYPWVNKKCIYPIGHPTIIRENFKSIFCYFGFAKVRILPPKKLYHPVLPFKHNGKLKFPLCKTCAELENKDYCKCSDDKRSFIGTWCTPELQMAVRKGYQIQKIFEVYHFKHTSSYDPKSLKGGLFSEYVDTFLKVKQESSGWPRDGMTDEEKDDYIDSYLENEGIELDKEKIEYNSGLRMTVKIILNSLWGKFSQRENLKKTRYFDESEVEDFFKMVLDPTVKITNFSIINPTTIQVEYESETGFIRDNIETNIFIGIFTTAWARLKLYTILDAVGENVLYYDTDSCIYVSTPDSKPLKLGNYLGELTSEVSEKEGGHIVEFVSAGPKNYAYITKNGHQVCKVRGFSLNFTNQKIINFASLKDIVLHDNSATKVVVNPNKICRSKTNCQIYSRPESKTYRLVYTKRVIMGDLDTMPYGTQFVSD